MTHKDTLLLASCKAWSLKYKLLFLSQSIKIATDILHFIWMFLLISL